MRFIVLGSAAGGGLPQWNCACPNCRSARQGGSVRPRTQSSVAVSADGTRWAIINASPDIGAQLRATPALWPDPVWGPRHSPIAQVFLTNADIDHIAGLLTLREGQPFELLATGSGLAVLEANPVFGVLREGVVARTRLELDRAIPLAGRDDVTVTPFAVPGKVALYQETADTLARIGERGEETIALEIAAQRTARRAVVVPGCATIDAALAARLAGADLVLFDGTLFDDDEMIEAGLSRKTGRRMGHVPMSGSAGSIDALAEIDIGRRVFIHVNNSNPVLCPSSPAATAVREAGWEIACDGLEITL